MDNYLQNFHKFNNIFIYDFGLGNGGIGDYFKFFLIILTECINNNIRFYQKINNIEIEKYIKLKFDQFYITNNEIIKLKNATIKKPNDYYHNDKYNGKLLLNEIFYFNDMVKLNLYNILPTIPNNYISIHLRLGDKFLETDIKFIVCPNNTRYYKEENLYKFIDDNSHKNIILFCDNNAKKLEIKNKYNNIIITDAKIGHTSLINTTSKQMLDAITEFYLLSNSKLIYAASYSGFSEMAAKFNGIQCIKD